MSGDVRFEHPALILHGQPGRRQGNFDAILNPDVRNARTNADLTIMIRVCLRPVNPRGGRGTMRDADNTAVPVRSWRPAEWRRWRSQYVASCQRFWHGKFWLRTPDAYRGLDWPEQNPSHRCNLWCRFELTAVDTERGAHATIPVVRVDGNHVFRSHALLYSNRDILAEQYPASGTPFYTHLHEIGHLLGLDHPGVGSARGCVSGAEMACYAANPNSVMGLGSRLLLRHADPWQRAAAVITSTRPGDWRPSMRRIYPRRI